MYTARSNGGRLAGRLITYQLNRKEATTGRQRTAVRGSKFVAARRELAPSESALRSKRVTAKQQTGCKAGHRKAAAVPM